ncbi:hypothetical protein LguiB_027173 [Lonicera macranthoides]
MSAAGGDELPEVKVEVDADEGEEEKMAVMKGMGSYGGKVRMVKGGEAWEEMMLLWGIQQPTLSKQNAFVLQSSLQLRLDSCGYSLSILQSPSSLYGSMDSECKWKFSSKLPDLADSMHSFPLSSSADSRLSHYLSSRLQDHSRLTAFLEVDFMFFFAAVFMTAVPLLFV